MCFAHKLFCAYFKYLFDCEVRVFSVSARGINMADIRPSLNLGILPDGILPETVEYPDHPWFNGVQYHPELKSRPFEPHPLFASFIAAAMEMGRLV